MNPRPQRRNFRYNPKLKEKARILRSRMTLAEKDLWYKYLRNHRYKFLRQKPIGDYIVDFYSARLKLVIELDGESHLGEYNERYDDKRTRDIESLGISLIRFWNSDVYNEFEAVCERISDWIDDHEKNPPSPLC